MWPSKHTNTGGYTPQAGGAARSQGTGLGTDPSLVERRQRNPRSGGPRIAQQLGKAFGIELDKDVVRRVLAAHYRPEAGEGGPSWLKRCLTCPGRIRLWSGSSAPFAESIWTAVCFGTSMT